MIHFLENINTDSLNMALGLIPLFAGLAALVAFVVIWWRKERTVDGVAASLGLRFDWAVPCDLGKTRLDVFTKGRGARVLNQISGVGAAGAAARFFDYEFTTGTGRDECVTLLTVALFEFKKPLFPAFALGTEGLFDKLKSALGWEDIDIPGDAGFSGKYCLSGADKAAVLAFWTPARRARFALPPRSCVEAGGRYLAIYRMAVSVSAKSYPYFIEDAKAAAAALAA